MAPPQFGHTPPRHPAAHSAFTDDGAGPHVNSDHFKKATSELGQALASTPRIVSRQVDGEGWDEMGEITVD
jgi:quinol monooxygenase YgiN